MPWKLRTRIKSSSAREHLKKGKPGTRPGKRFRLTVATVKQKGNSTVSNVVPLHSSNQSVSVLQVRPCPKPGGAVRAYADIRYHNATIKGLSIVQHNGSHFV